MKLNQSGVLAPQTYNEKEKPVIITRRHAESAVRLALILAATASMAACASRPKPQGPAAPSGPSGPANPDNGISGPSGPGGVSSGVIPGSQQDFAQNAGDRVFFDLDQYNLRSDAEQTLSAQAQWLSRYPNSQIRVEGNADERGTREYNLALGARRASAVREYLSTQGVSPSRMSTVSYGKDRPLVAGSDEESHQQNRNAHTVLVGR